MSPRESNPASLTRRFRGRETIVDAIEAARGFGRSLGLADEDLARLCIIVEELVANLYDHGGLAEQDEVELTLAGETAGIRVTMVDPGFPFDPWTEAGSTQPERGGGAGLALVHAWAEILSYDAAGTGNRLELFLPLRSPE
ncbi:MAG TPA: ATP-binding protein [Sphingomicrobium sp.]|nr:ATP-binding protein [Sphingomicrobium sp.]